MEAGFPNPAYTLPAADARSTASAIARNQEGTGSLFSFTSTVSMASFGMTIGRKGGRLMVMASRAISIRALRTVP
ncbi:hypothetical protein DSECCO2_486870 [anaerobic digester metagenome]